MSLIPMRSRLALLAVPLLMALSACASNFNANVSRFQAELPAPTGQTFAIVAENPRNAGGLEFSQYASLVAAQLQKVGYVPGGNPDTADLVVRFDYGVDQGRDKVRTTGFADPYWGSWYGGGFGGGYGGWGRPGFYGRRGFGGWGYGFYDPFFFGGPGWGGGGFNNVDVVTVFTSGVGLKIDRRADGKRLFEGKAEAASTSNRLPYLVPNLVEAMFTNFPGSSGETVRISIAPEKKKR